MRIHFIGIGGIGVSALAQYYLKKGHKISGSDLAPSEITKALEKNGVKVFIGKHKISNLKSQISNLDLKTQNFKVIYSPAVSQQNPELELARKLKIKCQSYPEALGDLTKKYFTIAVCGTHGKSTVTAMIGLLLVKAGLDPTVILGTKLKEFNSSNCRVGKSQYLVIEADEHFESFLNYWPQIIVLTALEPDHLDYYKTFKNYVLAFKKFISHLPKNGFLVLNKDDKNIFPLFLTAVKNVVFYSLGQKEAKKLKKILKIPGEHNISNALAALSVARVLKIPDKITFQALSEYKGSWRRFEEKDLKIGNCKLKIISDYAHHPTQIRVTLKAIREKFPKKKIICIYQPHQYQRTYYLFNEFKKAFLEAKIDKIFITDIYSVAGREKEEIKEKVSSKKLVEAINRENVIYLPKKKILDTLKKNLKGGEVVVIMGAGDIYKINSKFKMKNAKFGG